MKYKHPNSIWYNQIFMVISIIINYSCGKELSNNEYNNEKVALVANISSIEDYVEDTILDNNAKSSDVKNDKIRYKTVVESNDGFDAVVVDFKSRNRINAYKFNKKASSLLPPGTKYRIVLYEYNQSSNSETFKGQYLMTAGTTMEKIDVNHNKTYKWYAISYNSDVTPEKIIDPTSSIPTFDFTNKDVLYASGTITTTVLGNNPLDIRFKRLGSRIDLVFNAVGMSAWVLDELNVSFIIKKGKYNLKTGSVITSSVEDMIVSKVDEDFRYVDIDAGYYDISSVSAYTIAGVVTSPISPQLKKFRVVQHNSTNPATESTEGYTFGNGTTHIGGNWSFEIGTPTKSKYYTATINLVQAPITIGNVRFARGNIYDTQNLGVTPTTGTLNASSPSKSIESMRRYRFRKQNSSVLYSGASFQYSDYFRFKDSRAGSAPPTLGSFFNTLADDLDPCEHMYPYDTWKTPTNTEMSVLSGGTNNTNHIEFPGSGPVNLSYTSPYPSNNLRLEKKGYFENLLASSFYTYNSSPHRYWTQTKESLTVFLVTFDWHYYAEMNGSSYSVPSGFNGLGQWAQHSHYSIRCVRK